ncbi:MAG: hypothetical protein U0930_13070 [Pirellulales bacterium]
MLLDDFDPIFKITSELSISIERIAVAFCPRVSDLLDEETRKYIVPLHDKLVPTVSDSDLLAIARFKLGPLASLGQGLLVQQSILRAVAARILSVINGLKEKKLACQNCNILDKDLSPENLWCSLLNPQGFDELAIVIGTTNYSVAGAIIAGIRSLTLAHVYADGNEKDAQDILKTQIVPSSSVIFSRQQASQQDQSAGYNIPGYIQELLDGGKHRIRSPGLPRNHLFNSGFSTLAASENCINNIEDSQVGGYINVRAEFEIHPGHEDVITETFRGLIGEKSVDLGKSCDIGVLEMGVKDLSCTISDEARNEVLCPRGVRTDEFLKSVREYYNRFPQLANLQGGENGLRSVTSILCIPFPKLDVHRVPWVISPSPSIDNVVHNTRQYFEGHAPMVEALAHLRQKTEYEFNLKQLSDSLVRAGVPRALRISIRYLYQDFFLNIANAGSLDGVLDLYDAFSTFYFILTSGLNNRMRRYPEKDFETIKDLLDAFQNAFVHRVSAPHGFHEYHDVSIDWRGGMNQLTEAADFTLKGVEGLLKHWARENGKLEQMDFYKRVGSVTAVKLTPSAKCSRPLFRDIGDEKEWHSLSYLHVNVGHIFNPFMYIAYIHEGAHMIRLVSPSRHDRLNAHVKALRKQSAWSGDRSAQVRAKFLADRHDEQFANAIVYRFLFHPNCELFYKVSMTQLGMFLSPLEPKVDRSRRFLEYAIRIFLASDPWNFPQDWNGGNIAKSRIKDRFKKTTRNGIRWFAAADGIVDEPKFQEMMDVEIEKALVQSVPFAIDEWKHAMDVFDCYANWEKAIPWCWATSRGESGPMRESVLSKIRATTRDIIRESFRTGDATVANKIRRGLKEQFPEHFQSGEPVLDEFILVCELLQSYYEFLFNDIDCDKEVLVPRNRDSRKVDFDTCNEKKWNLFLFDHGASGPFCVDAESRKRHLKAQVVVLKKLWDMSTTMRGRRLGRMSVVRINDHSRAK